MSSLQVPDTLKQLVVSRARNRLLWRTPLRLRQDKVPTVDVLLPCCGEKLDVISDTIKACIVLDYPPGKFRIYVLDDDSSHQVESLVRELRRWGSKISPVEIVYAARQRKYQWLKAANLNFGLEFARESAQGPGEFVAVLDIDMIPEPAWLRALVPHMLQDDRLGLVGPPQRFYNIQKGSNVIAHIDEYMDLLTIVQNSLQSAYCTGSGFLARRAALESIHGFPTESPQDDILVSLHLRAKKWKVTFVLEDQQYGQRPTTLGSYTKQWVRWMAGALDMVMILRSPHLQTLPSDQRRTGSALVIIRFLSTITVALSMLGLLLTLLISGNRSVVFCDSPDELRLVFSLALLARATGFLYDYFLSKSTGFRLTCVPLSDIWLHPYRIQGLMAASLRRLGVPERFVAAGAQLNVGNPRGKPLTKRLKMVLWDSYAILHLVYFVALVVGLWTALSGPVAAWTLSAVRAIGPPAPALMSSIMYPPYLQLLYICCTQSFVPIGYALEPDKIIDREALLVRDEDGVAYPTKEAKDLDRTAALLGSWNSFSVVLGWYGLATVLIWTR